MSGERRPSLHGPVPLIQRFRDTAPQVFSQSVDLELRRENPRAHPNIVALSNESPPVRRHILTDESSSQAEDVDGSSADGAGGRRASGLRRHIPLMRASSMPEQRRLEMRTGAFRRASSAIDSIILGKNATMDAFQRNRAASMPVDLDGFTHEAPEYGKVQYYHPDHIRVLDKETKRNFATRPYETFDRCKRSGRRAFAFLTLGMYALYILVCFDSISPDNPSFIRQKDSVATAQRLPALYAVAGITFGLMAAAQISSAAVGQGNTLIRSLWALGLLCLCMVYFPLFLRHTFLSPDIFFALHTLTAVLFLVQAYDAFSYPRKINEGDTERCFDLPPMLNARLPYFFRAIVSALTSSLLVAVGVLRLKNPLPKEAGERAFGVAIALITIGGLHFLLATQPDVLNNPILRTARLATTRTLFAVMTTIPGGILAAYSGTLDNDTQYFGISIAAVVACMVHMLIAVGDLFFLHIAFWRTRVGYEQTKEYEGFDLGSLDMLFALDLKENKRNPRVIKKVTQAHLSASQLSVEEFELRNSLIQSQQQEPMMYGGKPNQPIDLDSEASSVYQQSFVPSHQLMRSQYLYADPVDPSVKQEGASFRGTESRRSAAGGRGTDQYAAPQEVHGYV
uniref:Uncharacterized protein n=1 Tax=Chromera velia CCMP2878 TaxID=1169474 RepID=A0A0G4FNR3_9ALVE|eukprot:Cvel_17956.t1-p1 / transcript=Cvel_17956.t1 / gene=Cvel_17956 / organism=Chromera_velia_CCMP2878 / gene_product=hypothetical protein / transcript_product=hypothetical protein / location=Cvel_scaffold1460:29115-32740(-) / protein_length=623 / sequence_SO=supercontig / SO=protein_coding / is_pseudo=false